MMPTLILVLGHLSIGSLFSHSQSDGRPEEGKRGLIMSSLWKDNVLCEVGRFIPGYPEYVYTTVWHKI